MFKSSILSEKQILSLIKDDKWMMDVLRTAQRLELPDWWICAGFVRSKIWDTLHGYDRRTPLADIDVIYFDPHCLDEREEKRLEQQLIAWKPGIPWSVKNQARMHKINNLPPYKSAIDGIAHFPETVTALGVKLETNGLILAAPHGISDVLQMHVRPVPLFEASEELQDVYKKRMKSKDWKANWPMVTVRHKFL